MKSNKDCNNVLNNQIISSKTTIYINPKSSNGLSSVADKITQQSYTYNSPEAKWLELDKSKINNSVDSKIMSLAKQLKEYENSSHMNVRIQLKGLAAQALQDGGYPNDYTIDDYMRANGMLPPLQEDPEMIRQLQRQITEMQEASRQRDVLLEQINQNNLQLIQGLTEAERIINEKDDIIGERDNTILQLQGDKDNFIETNTDLTNRLAISEENNGNLTNVNTDLTNRLATSEENNGNLTEELHEVRESNLDLINRLATSEENNGNLTEELHEVRESNLDLTNRLTNSEAKVGPLQQEVFGLKRDKEMLEIDKKNLQDDKNELREDKKC